MERWERESKKKYRRNGNIYRGKTRRLTGEKDMSSNFQPENRILCVNSMSCFSSYGIAYKIRYVCVKT